MAKSTTAKKLPKVAPLPKGFKPARSNLAGFFAREKGNSATGILRGSFELTGRFGKKRVFRVELTEGVCIVGEGEVVEAGSLVGIDETGYTKALGDLEPGTVVFVRYEGKAGEGEKDPHVFTIGKLEAE